VLRQSTPVAIHYGGLETRVLQLHGRPGSWTIRVAATLHGPGPHRDAAAMDALATGLSGIRRRGRDCLIGLSAEAIDISLVPVEEAQRHRKAQILRDRAARAVEDPEGVTYRSLELGGVSPEGAPARDEYLLLTLGQGVLRRCTETAEAARLRPVGLEADAFALARLHALQGADHEGACGFLHLGFEHSFFGILHEGEVRFLKPLQVHAGRMLQALERGLPGEDAGAAPGAAEEAAVPAEGGGLPAGVPRVDPSHLLTSPAEGGLPFPAELAESFGAGPAAEPEAEEAHQEAGREEAAAPGLLDLLTAGGEAGAAAAPKPDPEPAPDAEAVEEDHAAPATALLEEPREASAEGDDAEAEPRAYRQLRRVRVLAEEQAHRVLHALRLETEALAQEVRACLRHFHNRHPGARVHDIRLSGFGADLPEIGTALGSAFGLPVEKVRPFSSLGMPVSRRLSEEEHLWAVAVGLALRVCA